MSWDESLYQEQYERWEKIFGIRKNISIAEQVEYTPGNAASEEYYKSIDENQFEISKAMHDAFETVKNKNVKELPKIDVFQVDGNVMNEIAKDELFDEIFAHVEDYIAGDRTKDELLELVTKAILHYEKRIRD